MMLSMRQPNLKHLGHGTHRFLLRRLGLRTLAGVSLT